MKRSAKSSVFIPTKPLLFALAIIISGCSLEKKNGFNRFMQNVTAQYNILFNAKEILRLKQESYETSFVDNYNEILSVYQDTTAHTQAPDKDLDEAVAKANKIISIKEQSKYLGDAYLVLGQANYLGGNYYNAVEYFGYVTRSFPKRKDLLKDARIWETRTLIYLDKLPEAKLAIDSAIIDINPKKHIDANIYATKMAYDIAVADYADGVEMGKLAVKYCHNKEQRLRWTFIMAQLQELNNQSADAYKNYAKISNSNALFEMAFNASLNMIRIQDNANGVKINRVDKLLSLLKNPNNKEFKDQIYYQVAQIKLSEKDVDGAIKYYNLSLRASVKNQSQKGLSYLRLAEIYFNNKSNYVLSKKYYDSTLTTLPTNYPGYISIQKKGANLQLLADRLQIIALEDTLQSLAKMDEKTRNAVIDKMVSDKIAAEEATANAAAAVAAANTQNAASFAAGPGGRRPGGGKSPGSTAEAASSFYFDNPAAVGQGYTDFKTIWGNRKLEDNWRRSNRANSDVTNNLANSTQSNDPDAPINKAVSAKGQSGAANYRKQLIQGLPLTADLLAASNLRVYNAYLDIGNFYRDVMDDKPEAIAIFELLLKRFPNDPNRPAIYYNLYRLYSDTDPAKSDAYKNKLLKEYPETPFAKIISDPDYARKLNDANAQFTDAYNVIFDLYTNKAYRDVIECVPELLKQYPNNKLSAQLLYLKTIAEGHFEKVGPFTDSLQNIIKRYPNDKLIDPLINQHLAYINTNLASLQKLDTVLSGVRPGELPFAMQQEYAEKAPYHQAVRPAVFVKQPQQVAKNQVKKPAVPQTAKQPITQPVNKPPAIQPANTLAANPPAGKPAVTGQQPQTPNAPPATSQAATTTSNPSTNPQQTASAITSKPGQPDLSNPDATAPSIFSMTDSTDYYFVVTVSSGTTNLASSRFGIGQFTRANFAGKGYRHQLLAIGDNNQLIYVGRFYSLSDVKAYARQIVPLLPDIMKVPKDKYSFFIITHGNLTKLADVNTLESYIDYYQKNY